MWSREYNKAFQRSLAFLVFGHFWKQSLLLKGKLENSKGSVCWLINYKPLLYTRWITETREKSSKHKNGAQLHRWVVSGLPGTNAKWNRDTWETGVAFQVQSLWIPWPTSPYFWGADISGILVPQPLTEPAPLAVEVPGLNHEPPGKSQLALFLIILISAKKGNHTPHAPRNYSRHFETFPWVARAEQWEDEGERQARVTGGWPAAGLHSDFISGEQDSSEQGSDTVHFYSFSR